ncbi:hypothetical protein [Bacillus marasmi]|uniref:hypothetical protein n=1 Tax=Bacillus marasmi TaxID=1926279 RepID=UPI0011C914E1|nr:hypothetical protein [Bacillus marasmi]
MPNLLWFICLAVIGIVTTACAIYIKRDVYKVSTLLVFFMFTASYTWIGEFVVLGLFDAYAYKTGIFDNIWAQNLLGHLILNTTLYPATAVVMVAFSLRYGWISFVAASFSLTEFVFVKLNLYEQHWWKYYMTPLVVFIFLSLTRKWFNKMEHGLSGATRSITFFFVALLIIHTPAPILLLMGKQFYQLNWLSDLVGDRYLTSIIIIFFYHLIEALILVLFICVLKKRFLWIFPVIISISVQYIFLKMDILVLKDGWEFVYTLFMYEAFITLFILVEKFTLK